jgi:hypothetical protein
MADQYIKVRKPRRHENGYLPCAYSEQEIVKSEAGAVTLTTFDMPSVAMYVMNLYAIRNTAVDVKPYYATSSNTSACLSPRLCG